MAPNWECFPWQNRIPRWELIPRQERVPWNEWSRNPLVIMELQVVRGVKLSMEPDSLCTLQVKAVLFFELNSHGKARHPWILSILSLGGTAILGVYGRLWNNFMLRVVNNGDRFVTSSAEKHCFLDFCKSWMLDVN